ncbi:MAG TPA: hypothetical protein VID27_05930 [Blastocatellia bacterium]|jgi:hypothetical protein
MADEEINYVKEVMKSDINLGYVGLMAFLTIVFSWGFLPLLVAGEIGALFIAQHPRVQRLIRSRKNKDQVLEVQDAEKAIVAALPANYQNDFNSVRRLCEEIEKRSSDVNDPGGNAMLGGVIEKLSAFRYEYARMLRAHHMLSSRNYRNLQNMLSNEISRAEKAVEMEDSPQVKHALAQNFNILRKRLARIQKLDELVRLLEARLQVVRNSLSLIQDEVYTFTNVAGISDLVDNLLSNLSISDEFRSAYEDVLVAEASESGIASLEVSSSEADFGNQYETPPEEEQRRPPREHLRRVK